MVRDLKTTGHGRNSLGSPFHTPMVVKSVIDCACTIGLISDQRVLRVEIENAKGFGRVIALFCAAIVDDLVE